MHHATPLITTIVGGLVLAFILGMIANKLRISPLVGYLLAGVLAGPFTPGFVADMVYFSCIQHRDGRSFFWDALPHAHP